MGTDAVVRAWTNAETKARAFAALAAMGLSASNAIRTSIAICMSLGNTGLPFQ